MLPHKILQAHYKEYASKPNSWVANMAEVKCAIFKYVYDAVLSSRSMVSPHPLSLSRGERGFLDVVVLGASDKRYIKIHKKIFSAITHYEIDLTTYDIDTEHLSGEENIVYHDVTQPFPHQQFDIVFSHALFKFIEPENQIKVLKNSYRALAPGGFAMHVLHTPELKGTNELREWQYRVDAQALVGQLQRENIPARIITFFVESDVDWLRETTVIITEKKMIKICA